jgi:hypothetical protein
VKKDFRKLEDKLSNLTDLKEPERDLWPEISEKIISERRGKIFDFKIPLSMAAGAAIMFLGLFLGLQVNNTPMERNSFTGHLLSLEREYQRVKPLSFSAVKTGSAIPRESLILIEAELDNLDETTRILFELMKAHPNDPLIYRKMAELYEQKFQVLRMLSQESESSDSI